MISKMELKVGKSSKMLIFQYSIFIIIIQRLEGKLKIIKSGQESLSGILKMVRILMR